MQLPRSVAHRPKEKQQHCVLEKADQGSGRCATDHGDDEMSNTSAYSLPTARMENVTKPVASVGGAPTERKACAAATMA